MMKTRSKRYKNSSKEIDREESELQKAIEGFHQFERLNLMNP